MHLDMSNVITLYDIPSTLPENAWSPNVWKARLTLRVKGLQFKTVWVEFPDIESVCKNIGAKPTRTGYTLPVIHDPSTNTVVSDSAAIARYLDATYPDTTRLFPPGSDALQEAFQIAFLNTVLPLAPIMQPMICTKLNPVSEVYYRQKREARSGKKMEPSPARPQPEHWKQVEEAFGVMDSWLATNGEGKPFVMGDTISYADITIAGWILCMKIISRPESQEWKDVLRWHGGRWAAFIANFTEYEGCIV